jgi:predicted nuclease of predicted toxin-antitoxin system
VKLKLDENLPVSLAPLLSAMGHDVDTALDEGLAGCDDFEVWKATQQAERFFVTQDKDFSDVRRFAPGTHAGVLLVRLDDPFRVTVRAFVGRLFAEQPVESWTGCFVVATERSVRVRRP